MKNSRYSLDEKKAKKVLWSFNKESGQKQIKFNSRYVQPGDECFKKVGDALKSRNKKTSIIKK